jgi:hypothetical protein
MFLVDIGLKEKYEGSVTIADTVIKMSTRGMVSLKLIV